MTATLALQIGFTTTDRLNNYVPAMDGYRPGAAQDTVKFEVVNSCGGWNAHDWERIAEAVFILTNAPGEVIESYAGGDSATGYLLTDLMAALRAEQITLPRSVSVGDTVTVINPTTGEEGTWACARFGWTALNV